jgi:hypothetical protein
MIANLKKLLRGVVAALLLGFWTAPTADAAWWIRSQSSARTEPAAAPQRGDPMRGLAVIAGAVALLIFLAWLALRIGEADRPADKVPN